MSAKIIGKTLGVTVVDGLILVVHGAAVPTDEEWGAYLELVRTRGAQAIAHLIPTEGGQPTDAQRGQLDELAAGRTIRIAVLSDIARVHVTLKPFWGSGIRAFRPSELSLALAHLWVPVLRREVARSKLNELRAEFAEQTRGGA